MVGGQKGGHFHRQHQKCVQFGKVSTDWVVTLARVSIVKGKNLFGEGVDRFAIPFDVSYESCFPFSLSLPPQS